MLGSSDSSTLRAVHRLLEHYTPDGTLGRLLLGLSALGLSPFMLFGGVIMITDATTFVAFLTGVLGVTLGPFALLLGVVTLWPVYLSLIGNVESPADYATTSGRRRSSVGLSGTDSVDPVGTTDLSGGASSDDESAEAILKRRYAAGDIDDAEFERRLERIMTAEAGEDWDNETTRNAARSRRKRETEQVEN
ncbi:SHOCT domain-containing protein [Salinirubrum litoreum]|uniref:SHOCT domain-containing protein n=1 Tax=Salinirubrum litoreum TaxID=1126234 RepID=A0ABD5RCZ7_9EURY|nr:SHOCT domain-containing protein [Salinirubrum litoreum]